MRLKTHHLGKPPRPYDRAFEDFILEADERITVFEGERIGSGPFEGKSPHELFRGYIESGWRPVLVDAARLDAAFCSHETRLVCRGGVKVGGRIYRHHELINGQRVTIALPWRREARPLALLRGVGWTSLDLDELHQPTRPHGARESGRRARAYNRLTSALAREAGLIDLEANRRDRLTGLRDDVSVRAIQDPDALPDESSLAVAMSLSARQHPPATRMSESEARSLETSKLELFLANDL